MLGSRLNKTISNWLKSRFGAGLPRVAPPTRGQTIHVIIIDGTMSTLDPGDETNAGLTAKLLGEMGSEVSLYYEPGLQWSHWRKAGDVIFGRGINRQIRRAYGYLASRYRPGDKVFLLGYSRGAYAVRSLAGIIDRVGLLKPEAATERNIRDVYRHYECSPDGDAARIFVRNNCHGQVEIEMIGVWDTVKSLGLNMPFLWRLSAPRHAFHNHQLGRSVKHGFHAIARNETRVAYAPVMWDTTQDWDGHLVQMWFRGVHGDIGGHLSGRRASRPLANIPLVWMLEQAEACGLPLPEGWAARFPQDAEAPSMGTFAGFGKWFITRKPRRAGLDPSERVHPSLAQAPPPRSWSEWVADLRGTGADAL
ncbi:hypothetical protein GCM10007385_25190 [Tateyamaria omphalii]|uniref:DUF2235 domain-containing protein n=1 Tax=Tateyamaria omphalii TaxID=299262 RepID=UPI00167965A6|nr:DUF2235 domain-containing protein [Tateyamaria omphalii]GGX55598.1 hypothetical protein GCM10007385_25190 [Tateyamaria omphalii]